MEQIRISELPEAYDGEGYVPIVQYGETRKYDLSNKIDVNNIGDIAPEYWTSTGTKSLQAFGFGHVTNSSKAFEIFCPWAKAYTGNYTITDLSICPRWSNVGYVYARSGSGTTYTVLHDGSGNPISIWEEGTSVRANEVQSVVVTPYQSSGFRIRVNFNYAIAKSNTGTNLENNSCGDFLVEFTIERS